MKNLNSKFSMGFPLVLASVILSMPSLAAGNWYADNGASDPSDPQVTDGTVTSRVYRTWDGRIDNSVLRSSSSASVTTYHNDLLRTGANLSETTLTPANVRKATFGKIFAFPATGIVYGQPLVAPTTFVPPGGNPNRPVTHNVVFFGTLHDQIYAYDADTLSTRPIWHRDYIGSGANAGQGDTAYPCPSAPCATWDYTDMIVPNISPELGIVATPVIDDTRNIIYFTVATKENGNYVWRIHALNMSTGAEAIPAQDISGTLPGNGAGSVGGNITFSAVNQLSRAGLVLDQANNRLYVAFTSFDDIEPTHGWVFVYNATTLGLMGQWMTTPDTGDGTIWQAGGAPGLDANGDLYFATGNGDPGYEDARSTPDFSDSVMKLTYDAGNALLKKADFFTPHDWLDLADRDVDLGSGGVVLLPDQPGTKPHLMIAGGKGGTVYLINRDTGSMGQNNASTDNVVAELTHLVAGNSNHNGMFGTPAFYNNKLYIIPNNDFITVIPLDNSTGTTTINASQVTRSTVKVAHRGATPSVSANGNSNGIVWYIDPSAYTYSWSGTIPTSTTAGIAAPANTTADGPAVL